MKVFRVVLHSFGPTYIEADSCVQDSSIRFYRSGELLAEYQPSTVKSVEETEMPVQGGIFEASVPEEEEPKEEQQRHEDGEPEVDDVRG